MTYPNYDNWKDSFDQVPPQDHYPGPGIPNRRDAVRGTHIGEKWEAEYSGQPRPYGSGEHASPLAGLGQTSTSGTNWLFVGAIGAAVVLVLFMPKLFHGGK